MGVRWAYLEAGTLHVMQESSELGWRRAAQSTSRCAAEYEFRYEEGGGGGVARRIKIVISV